MELLHQEIAGMSLELYVLRFEKEKMTLRVPVNKVESVGMRKLSSDKTLKEALDILKTKPKVKRTMWSRPTVVPAATVFHVPSPRAWISKCPAISVSLRGIGLGKRREKSAPGRPLSPQRTAAICSIGRARRER